jgi:hypothetical protein
MRLLLSLVLISFSLNAQVLLKEDFNSLKNWEPLLFEKIKEHSTYEIKDSTLVAKSKASASGIKFKKTYDIFKYPKLSFKWKVNNIYKKGDATTKDGDDYSIRIYVMFEYNPKKASFFEQVKYDFAKSIYGEYPPHSTVNYIWSNKKQNKKIITSAYTNRSKMIVLNSGSAKLNTWQEHTVNVLDDYKKAFGENPPQKVTLAIMTDSDNTKESSLSYIDFIEVKQSN